MGDEGLFDDCNWASEPRKKDVIFDVDDHFGTKEFTKAVQRTARELGPSCPFSPVVYKHIKRQLKGRQFYKIGDDDDDQMWREVPKRELITLFSTHYEQA